ncbi:MAG: phosphotransferase [Brooklawnia sp.]|jgi:5-methylthioribose kinase
MAHDVILTAEEFVAHVRNRTDYFEPNAPLRAELITGTDGSQEGYVNQVARVVDQGSGRSVMVKQTLPFVRRALELTHGKHGVVSQHAIPMERSSLEVEAFELWNGLTPHSAPVVYDHDPDRCITIMEDLHAMKLARFEFSRLREFPHFGRQMGEFLARNAFYTSDFTLASGDRLMLARRFMKPAFDEMYERAFFDWPYFSGRRVPEDAPIQAELDAFIGDPKIRSAILGLRHTMMNRMQSLIHRDFHTSNIFVNAERVTVIDGEAAGWGPPSYDIGTLIGNLINSCLSLQLREEVSWPQKIVYEDYLIDVVRQIMIGFNQTFSEAWQAHAKPEYCQTPEYLESLLIQTLQEAIGYAAIIAIDMSTGPGLCYEFRSLPPHNRATAQRLTIFTAREMMVRRHTFTSIDQLTDLFKQIKNAYRISDSITAGLGLG